MEGLVSLNILNLRRNHIENFEENLPIFESLKYLNLRENKFDKFEEIQKITSISSLEILIVSFNPIITKMQEAFYFETINIMPKLKRLNKI